MYMTCTVGCWHYFSFCKTVCNNDRHGNNGRDDRIICTYLRCRLQGATTRTVLSCQTVATHHAIMFARRHDWRTSRIIKRCVPRVVFMFLSARKRCHFRPRYTRRFPLPLRVRVRKTAKVATNACRRDVTTISKSKTSFVPRHRSAAASGHHCHLRRHRDKG